MSAATGLAAAIEVNPNVDPSQGGNPTLLRDGGISDPGNPAYTYNTTGAASYTGRIQELIGQISATQSFDPSAGLDSSASLTDYANASVSWVQAENQQASNASSYQNALATQATSALSNATGVNLDAEMTNMLNLENSYASSAKLLTTVTSMFTALLQAA
jgi:flagellar hook-associated protein 1 FlgK